MGKSIYADILRCSDDNGLTPFIHVVSSGQKSLMDVAISNYGVMQCCIISWDTLNNYSLIGTQLTEECVNKTTKVI